MTSNQLIGHVFDSLTNSVAHIRSYSAYRLTDCRDLFADFMDDLSERSILKGFFWRVLLRMEISYIIRCCEYRV